MAYWADMGEFCVFIGYLPMEVAAVSCFKEFCSSAHGRLPFDAEIARLTRKLSGEDGNVRLGDVQMVAGVAEHQP
jgi:hypothetical protein